MSGEKDILITYFSEDEGYSFAWVYDENEVEDWLIDGKKMYSDIEIIKVRVERVLYSSN